MTLRTFFAAGLVASLGGCAKYEAAQPRASYEITGSIQPVGSSTEGPASAVSTPPTLGSVSRVSESRFPNGARQTIALDGDGAWNNIEITVQTRPRAEGRFTDLDISPPSESGVRTEVLSRFPKMQMGIVSQPARNAQGPIGIAVGKRADGARCIFAWQWIEDVRAETSSSGLVQLRASLSGRSVPASIRVRICRKDRTLDELAAAVEGVSLLRGPALTALLQPPMANATNNRLVTPISGSLESEVPDAGKSGARAAALDDATSTPAARRKRHARPKRHIVARRHETAPVEQSDFAAPEMSRAERPRYLAPAPVAAVDPAPVSSIWRGPPPAASVERRSAPASASALSNIGYGGTPPGQ